MNLYKYCPFAHCKSDYFISPRYTAKINMIYSEVVLILAGFSVCGVPFTLGNIRYSFLFAELVITCSTEDRSLTLNLVSKHCLILGHYLEWSLFQLRFKFTSL